MNPNWNEIEVPVTIRGRYKVESGLVTVECGLGSKTTQVKGNSPPRWLARDMIKEMIKEMFPEWTPSEKPATPEDDGPRPVLCWLDFR